jgi:hypothetical protein
MKDVILLTKKFLVTVALYLLPVLVVSGLLLLVKHFSSPTAQTPTPVVKTEQITDTN